MNRSALVIGGGPAGLSAGIALARRGFDVEVHEQRPEWKGRVCGSFLSPDAVRALEWMDLLDEARQRGAVAVIESTLVSPSGRVSRTSTMQEGTPSLAFQRRKLEELLRDELERRGGRLIEGSRVLQSERRGGEWVTVARLGEFISHIHTGIVVRAAGRFSETTPARDGGWYGWNALFCNVRQSPGEMAMFFGRRSYIGVLTFSDGTTNVCGLSLRTRGGHDGWDDAFNASTDEHPMLSSMVAGARRLDDWRGVGPLPFTTRPRTDTAILAGDAAAVGDPFMGEGIGRALATAPLIGAAIDEAGPDASDDDIVSRYGAMWRRAYARRLSFGWAARWLMERPWLSRPILGGLLRPAVIGRTTPLFHRGVGFDASVTASRKS